MQLIRLKHCRRLAKGTSRLVYAHPTDQDLLVKVMRSDFLVKRRKSLAWYKRLRPGFMLSIFAREIREQIVLLARGEDTEKFLERVVGFCDTDLGIGLIVKAVRDGNGVLAPQLAELIKRGGFDAEAQRDFESFCATLLASRVTVGGIRMRNIVYGFCPDGERRFIMIDGFGESGLVPWRSVFPHLNRLAKRRHVRSLQAEVYGRLAASKALASVEQPIQRAEHIGTRGTVEVSAKPADRGALLLPLGSLIEFTEPATRILGETLFA
jgi:hypothetical protein